MSRGILALFLLIHTISDLKEGVVYDAVLWLHVITGLVMVSQTGFHPASLLYGGIFLALSCMGRERYIGRGDGLVLLISGLYLDYFEITGVITRTAVLCLPAAAAAGFRRRACIPFMPLLLGGLLWYMAEGVIL